MAVGHYPCHQFTPCLLCLAFEEMKVEIPYPFLDIDPPDMCPDCEDAVAYANSYEMMYY